MKLLNLVTKQEKCGIFVVGGKKTLKCFVFDPLLKQQILPVISINRMLVNNLTGGANLSLKLHNAD